MEIQEIIDNFSIFESWEDKYQYLIELGQSMSGMPENEKTEANEVKGCTSRVWISYKKIGDRYYFTADSDAFIVKGLVSVLLMVLCGKTENEIKAIDIENLFSSLGLSEHLSPTRRNGFFSMVKRIYDIVDGKI